MADSPHGHLRDRRDASAFVQGQAWDLSQLDDLLAAAEPQHASHRHAVTAVRDLEQSGWSVRHLYTLTADVLVLDVVAPEHIDYRDGILVAARAGTFSRNLFKAEYYAHADGLEHSQTTGEAGALWRARHALLKRVANPGGGPSVVRRTPGSPRHEWPTDLQGKLGQRSPASPWDVSTAVRVLADVEDLGLHVESLELLGPAHGLVTLLATEHLWYEDGAAGVPFYLELGQETAAIPATLHDLYWQVDHDAKSAAMREYQALP